jgi:uncharacterized lipoprotein YehR (DUF1307 family)
MKKKIVISIIAMVALFTITGCENSNETGDLLLSCRKNEINVDGEITYVYNYYVNKAIHETIYDSEESAIQAEIIYHDNSIDQSSFRREGNKLINTYKATYTKDSLEIVKADNENMDFTCEWN